MYGKIFDSMYEGTLYGHWEAIVTLQQMLVLCNRDGVIDMTPQAIAARTSIPLEILMKGIGILTEPDPYSRTPGEDGKRIMLLDHHRPWGWFIVNYAKYRDMKSRQDKMDADRERIAEKRKRNKNNNVAESRGESQPVANVAYVDVPVTVSVDVPTSPQSGAKDPVKDEIWKTGRAILQGQGDSRDTAGSFLGKLCKEYGQILVLDAVRDCAKVTPAEAKAWLIARCQERRANSGNKQTALEERNRRVAEEAAKEFANRSL